MFGKLSSKLTFFMVLVSAFTIIIAGTLTNRTLDKQFASFLDRSQQDRNQQVAETIKTLVEGGAELNTLEQQLELLGVATDAVIVVNQEWPERGMGRHMMHGHGTSMMSGRMQGMMRQTTENFTLPDGSAATIEIIPAERPERILQERNFRKAINQSILLTGLISIGGALILSFLFSRGLTKPLDQLITMVRRVGKGDLKQRTVLEGKDEFSYLGREFNQMAANLEHLEKIRLKLTNDVAHEFRTPIATIQAYLEAMSEGVLECSAENVALVLEETQRLNQLLTGLQELSKLERPLTRREKVDLGGLLEDLVRSLAILADEEEIELSLERMGEQYILGDEKMLVTAFRNLIINGIKYTPRGGKVNITLTPYDSYCEIVVADTGIGMESQDLPLIFERFYRTDLSRSRATGGTGIGLAVTAEIIQGHEGTIEVQSEVGIGSTFRVRLPQNSVGGTP